MNDMTTHQPLSTAKPTSSPSSRNTARHLVRNVTAENYQEVGKAFIGAYGGAVVALADGKSQGTEWTASPRQWGAWRAYFAKRKISLKFMDARGREGKCWTVPADWPHNFDGDATLQEDQQAAEWFMRNYRPERLDLASQAKRAATVAAYKTRMPPPHQYPSYRPEPEDVRPSFIDKDKLLQDYERDVAEYRAAHSRDITGA